MRRSSIVLGLLALALPRIAAGAEPPTSRIRYALSGKEAREFAIPPDLTLVRQLRLAPYGLSYERYQQRLGPAAVLGGQVTLLKDASGATVAVLGARYSPLTGLSVPRLSKAEAQARVARKLGPGGTRRGALMVDPATRRHFYLFDSRGRHERWVDWVDAGDGRVLRSYDGRQTNHGTGVKGDTKSLAGLDGLAGTGDDLTTFHNAAGHGQAGPHWDFASGDGRHQTLDARNGPFFAFTASDADNHWTLVTPDRASPGQPALVDAQYYAQVTDGYLREIHGFDWITGCGYAAMQSVAHYDVDYVNAFWDGSEVVYGDGDGFIAREFSGALDIVAHEYTHGVTECTSGLVYLNESGALNESFSDMLGNAAEAYAAERSLDPAASPDWWIGEDIFLLGTSGFRNMGDPAENLDPDHYSERQVGGDDNGGVHTNSGIPNHAFFLLVNGGSNAGEAQGHPHAGPAVAGIGLAAAERIFFLGFTGLAQNATMCDARAATETAAATLFGSGSAEQLATTDAWLAVGLTDVVCNGEPPEAPSGASASTLSSSRIRLTWTDNSASEDGFQVERSTDGASFTEVANLGSGATAYTDTGLLASTSYHYRVRSYFGPQFSDYSNVAQATTDPPPSAPSGLTASAVSSGRINLAWVDNAVGEAGFRLERSPDGVDFAEIATLGPNVQSYANSGLDASTTYHYRVRAYDGPNVSAYSNVARAATEDAPAAPTSVTATVLSSSRVKLAWTDVATNETGYRVERSTDGVSFTLVATLGKNVQTYTNSNLSAATLYHYRVGATDTAHTSYASPVPATTLPVPPAPTALGGASVSSSRIDLSWVDNASYEMGYRVERSPDGVTFSQIKALGANATGYSNTGLAAETAYFYRVSATDGPNASAYSNVVQVATLAPPPAPSNLTATALSSIQVALAWADNSAYEQGFRVERSTDGVSFTQIASLGMNATSYSANSLTAGVTYHFRVRANDGPNVSAYSNVASATTLAPPSGPASLTATPVSSSRVNLAWTDTASDESGFKVERSLDGLSFTQIASVGANVTTYANTSLATGTSYYFRVRSYAGSNYSEYSNVAQVVTLAPPTAPSGLTVTPVSSSRINLAWADDSTYEQGFKVERSTDGVSFTQIASPGANTTSYANTSLTSGVTYHYRVRAYDGPNYSGYSSTASATTLAPPSPPANLTATAVSSSRINLAWVNNSTYQQGIRVERSTDGVNFTQIVSLGANATSYASNSLASGATYHYRVRAYDGPNYSAYSNVASATTP
jgi:Zn-dependent metalloprotease